MLLFCLSVCFFILIFSFYKYVFRRHLKILIKIKINKELNENRESIKQIGAFDDCVIKAAIDVSYLAKNINFDLKIKYILLLINYKI